MKNAIGRELPETIGSYRVRPYAGPYSIPDDYPVQSQRRQIRPHDRKLLASLREAVELSGLQDGMTISFHHCFREGDRLIGQVLEVCRELGLKDLCFAPSAVVNLP